MITIIHVNRQHIAMNAKDGGNRPVYIVRQGRSVRYARAVQIDGPAQFVQPVKPLPCGAKAWLETRAAVTLVDEMTFQESRA